MPVRLHIAVDPDAEIITATTVTAGNTGDAAAAGALLADDLPAATCTQPGATVASGATEETGAAPVQDPVGESEADGHGEQPATASEEPLAVYGDAAYGAGALLADLQDAGAKVMTKVAPPVAPGGRFAKDRFVIDPAAGTVSCPAGVAVSIRAAKAGGGTATFGAACGGCPLVAECTTSRAGRTITIGAHENELVRARTTQQDPAWRADYRATRPKVERKIGHLMRRRHGGRRARVRGRVKVAADFSLLAAATNLARLGVLGLTWLSGPGWAASAS